MAKRTFLIAISILAVMTFVLVAGPRPEAEHAEAAFPGANGKIAFTTNRDGNADIYL